MNCFSGKDFQRNFLLKWSKRLTGSILILGILIGCNGCFFKHITLTVRSNVDANKGQPVYLMVRSVTAKEFLTESYQDIANKLFVDTDPSILAYQVILPGQKQKIKIEEPGDTPLGVYCLFTQPGDQWKMMLPQPLHFRYQITLEEDRIVEKSHE